MKRFLSALLALGMVCALAVTAFAADNDSWVSKEDVYPGDTITVHGFYTKDGEELDESDLDTEYYRVAFSGKKNGDYVEDVYIDNSDSEVKLVIKSGLSVSSEKEISGTVTVRDREDSRKRFEAEITLTLGGGGTARMEYAGNMSFELPDEYQTKKVKFETEDGDTIGTLRADFWDENYDSVAYFNVKVVDQSSLFLGHNSTPDIDLLKKYETADLRFLTWSAAPTFDASGTLGIYCYEDDYVYGRKADGSLYKLDGKYNDSTGAFEIKTKTLGSYVISDKALSASGSASGSGSSASSSTPAPSSSSVAPPPSSSTPAPSSSSVAPPPSSSSVAPPPSSSSSSASSESSVPEESSQPEESSLPEESSEESEEPSEPVDAPEEEDGEDGGFPVVPVVIGVLAVVVIGLAVFLFAGSKKKRGYDSWDD